SLHFQSILIHNRAMTTIPGDLSHLQPAHRPYALLANAERVDWIRQERWINYTRAEQVLARLGELLRYPPRHRMPALLLFGATGMGRTRIIQRFLRENDSHFDEVRGTTRLPVVALQMPPTPHERDFYEELLGDYGSGITGGAEFDQSASARART